VYTRHQSKTKALVLRRPSDAFLQRDFFGLLLRHTASLGVPVGKSNHRAVGRGSTRVSLPSAFSRTHTMSFWWLLVSSPMMSWPWRERTVAQSGRCKTVTQKKMRFRTCWTEFRKCCCRHTEKKHAS